MITATLEKIKDGDDRLSLNLAVSPGSECTRETLAKALVALAEECPDLFLVLDHAGHPVAVDSKKLNIAKWGRGTDVGYPVMLAVDGKWIILEFLAPGMPAIEDLSRFLLPSA